MPTLTKRTAHYVEVPDTDISFEAEGPLPDVYDDVFVEDLTGTEVGAHRVTWLVHDDCAYDMMEWSDPTDEPTEWVNGCFRDFRNSHHGGGEVERDEFFAEMVEAVGEDHVFVVEVYSHGLESFSVVNTKWYPDRQWDVAPACVLAVPPDVTNPREWADGVMEQYTSWANGDVWLMVTHYVKPDGTVDSCDIVGGFIGHEYAVEAAKSGDY